MFDPSQQQPLAPLMSALPGLPKQVMDRLSQMRFRFVQITATEPGMRPRDLDQSARRDLLASLRRRELAVAGLDVFIPQEHFKDQAHVSRAVDATAAAISLAADLGRCPVSLTLPANNEGDGLLSAVIESIMAAGHKHGVLVADHALAPADVDSGVLGVGIDPPAWLAAGADPATAVSEHAAHLFAARLSDLNTSGMRCAPGAAGGRLDLLAYRAALAVAGYEQPVVLDSRQWLHPWEGVEQSAARWANTMSLP